MARFLFAWELGANLGHATRLRPVAESLVRRGHEVDLAVRDLAGARSMLGSLPRRSYQAPIAVMATPRHAWTLADVLLSCGYGTPESLGALVDGWLALFEASACQALVIDHAPTAMLAARVQGLPVVHVGHGFSIPPRVSPLPVFRDWVPCAPEHAAESDARALAHVNQVLVERGAAPLGALCDLFHPPATLLCSWPELDQYGGLGRKAGDYIGPDCEVMPGAPAAWPDRPGPRVFAYLRATHPDTLPLLQALVALGVPALCFVPDATPAFDELRKAPSLVLSAQPVDMKGALDRCALLISHSGHATLAQGLRAGVQQLLLPVHAEQFLVARQLERTGVAVNAATRPQPVAYPALLAAMLRDDSPWAASARSMAVRRGSFDPAGLTRRIADAAEAVLPPG